MDSSDPPVYFGEWLKRRRKTLDLTQAELAERAGCSVPAIRKIESGERRPSKQLAGLLAKGLEIPAEDQQVFVRVARGELQLERLSQQLITAASPSLIPSQRIILPIAPTSLIGRGPELAALKQLLIDPNCRLLSLIGPGGIGKTRLAIDVAHQNQNLFPDGACFAPLASLSSPAFLVPSIADVLGFTFQGHVEPRVQLLNYISSIQMLLVLDNAEHLLDGVELFAEILECSPDVKLLVTSRERLNIRGEWVFEIQGLPVPPADRITDAEKYSSVELFIQSARQAQTGFALGDAEIGDVVFICQMVDGMPLGIELAAAWVPVLTCREIAREIQRGMDFLATTMRDVPARQRSLRATFDHSWNLLPTDERQVLSRLAVFRGGFERDAAEQIAGATLLSLSSLVSKSLVRHRSSGRYDLHEVIRQYARTHLTKDLENESIFDRHCDYYLALLQNREGDLRGAAQHDALRELTDEIDNLRGAWKWALEKEMFASIEPALRSFGWLYEMRGWFQEGGEHLEPLILALSSKSEDKVYQRVLGQAIAQQALLLFRQGQFSQALARFDDSLDILRPIDDPALLLEPLIFKGIILFLNGAYDDSKSITNECLACARSVEDGWFEAYAFFSLGTIDTYQGFYIEAYEKMFTGLTMWRELGDARYTALALNWISPTAIRLGFFEKAEAFLQESLVLCKRIGDRWGIGTAYRHLGLLALRNGDIPEARALFLKSLETFSGFITGWDVVRTLIYLGDAASTESDLSEARRIYQEAINTARKARATSLMLEILIGLAVLNMREGETEQALAFSILALNHPSSTQDTRDRASQLIAEAELHFSPEQIERAKKQFRNQSLKRVVEKLDLEEMN